MDSDREQAIARKGRHIGLVIAGTAMAWLVLTLWVGPSAGLSQPDLVLIDLAALAAFVYAAIKIYQLWRLRRDSQR